MSDKKTQLQHPNGVVIVYPASELHGLPTATLREELGRLLTITADHLLYLSAVWQELERRGEDMSDLRSGMAVYLPMIASRRLDAEAVIHFAGNRSMISVLSTLPLEEQRRLARGASVPVLITDYAGEVVQREIKASDLTPKQIRQVFEPGRIRQPEDQKKLLGQYRPNDKTVAIRLSPRDHQTLKIRAAETGKNISDLVIAALIASGLLTTER